MPRRINLFVRIAKTGFRCWKFDENAKWASRCGVRLTRRSKTMTSWHYDKLVVICSEHSLQSPAVIREIERALQKEDRERKSVLFPVRVDDYLFNQWDHPRKADVVSKVVGDFRGRDNLGAYSKDLRAFPLRAQPTPVGKGSAAHPLVVAAPSRWPSKGGKRIAELRCLDSGRQSLSALCGG